MGFGVPFGMAISNGLKWTPFMDGAETPIRNGHSEWIKNGTIHGWSREHPFPLMNGDGYD